MYRVKQRLVRLIANNRNDLVELHRLFDFEIIATETHFLERINNVLVAERDHYFFNNFGAPIPPFAVAGISARIFRERQLVANTINGIIRALFNLFNGVHMVDAFRRLLNIILEHCFANEQHVHMIVIELLEAIHANSRRG